MCYVVNVAYVIYVVDWCIWDGRLSHRYVLNMTLYVIYMCMMSLVIVGGVGVGVGGGFVDCVVYVLYVYHLVWYVVRSWGFIVYEVGWSEKCEY